MSRQNGYLKTLLSLWQILAMCGLLGGLIWAMTRPNWILHDSNQILIEGNRLLPRQAILSLLPLTYPKWLLQVSPAELSQAVESNRAIADVTITRRLFPSSLVVQVQERVPVAIAIPPAPTTTPQPKAAMGFLDPDGVLIPLQSYPDQVRQFLKSPNLKVIGVPESYRSYWSALYQAVSNSSVKVMEIDCQDRANLILKTELGIVHLGPYTPRLAEQFKVLEQMRPLPKQVNLSQIEYIDLKNPANPLVQTYPNSSDKTGSEQLQPTPEKVKPESPFVKKNTP